MAAPRGRARRDRGPEVRQGPERAFHQQLRALTNAFSRGVSSSLSLEGALQTLASDANHLLGASRTSVWLHQRRVRRLVLGAFSAPGYARTAGGVSTDDPPAPAARAMRLELPAFSLEPDGPMLLVPLRGWRRALGALV